MQRTVFVWLLSCLFCSSALAAPSANALFHYVGGQTNTQPDAWKSWSPRPEVAPRFSFDAHGGRTGAGALKLESAGKSSFGAWRRRVDGVEGRKTYRFSAWYRAESIAHERRSIIARLEWLDAKGKTVRPPDYAIDATKDGPWTKVEYVAPVPEAARSVDVQLSLGFSENGRVWWDDIQLVEEPSPPQRQIRAMTVYCRPNATKSSEKSVEQFCSLVETNSEKPDIICLPEGITVVGTGKTYEQVSEALPGPTTARLGALGKRLHCYIVAGLYERSGKIVYNTAVLIDRDGRLVGSS